MSRADATLQLDSATDEGAGLPSFRWTICALLFLATTINYMDRQVLGLLAPTLEHEIGWSELQYGHIVIAFQSAYAIGLLACGRLIDRWGTRRGYAFAIAVWSFAAAAHALARSVVGFGIARFALGIGESGNFPAAIKTVAEWFPKRERALATGLFNCGSNIGAIIAPLIVPPIAYYWGWQGAFVALGAAGLVWVVFWLAFYRRPEESPYVSASQLASLRADEVAVAPDAGRITWIQLADHKQTWAYCLQGICASPIGWFYLFWLPKFFHERYGLSLSKSSGLLAITYSMSLLGSVGGGLLPAWLLRRGSSLNFSRKGTLLVCVLMSLPMTQVDKINNVWFATILIGFAQASLQAWAANAYTMVSDLFPKRSVASLVGLGSALASGAAILLAEVVGKVLENTGSYRIPFLIAGLSLAVAWLCIHLLAPRWEAVEL